MPAFPVAALASIPQYIAYQAMAAIFFAGAGATSAVGKLPYGEGEDFIKPACLNLSGVHSGLSKNTLLSLVYYILNLRNGRLPTRRDSRVGGRERRESGDVPRHAVPTAACRLEACLPAYLTNAERLLLC